MAEVATKKKSKKPVRDVTIYGKVSQEAKNILKLVRAQEEMKGNIMDREETIDFVIRAYGK